VRTITPGMRQDSGRSLGGWVRDHNTTTAVPGSTGLFRDAMGKTIPSGATIINQTTNNIVVNNFTRITNVVGRPTNSFLFVPRTTFVGGFFGAGDGFSAFRHRHHHSLVVISFFYPFYFSDPSFLGFYYPGYYPSVYSLWGWCPGWVYPDRVYYNPYAYAPPAPYSGGYALDTAGAERAINDMRHAWLEGDIKALSAHLTDQLDIQVYFDGKYSYTASMKDYYAMTADTMGTTQTVSMDFGDPVWVSSNEVFYAGQQVFNDPDGAEHTVYVSYRLRKLGSDWYVVGVGSGTKPIESAYKDFRY